MNSEDDEMLPLNHNCPPSKKICALKADLAQKICADRVVGTLSIAIKELVENSIDAGATSIQIRIKEYGLESIEVVDDGKGVQESDFEALAQSYHTSKMTEFSDLDSIATFGFRGEALSSLCRVCDGLLVVTRHASATCASKLEYDASGKLVKKTPCSGLVGTKVTLSNLFCTLPVRRKVFVSKCKQEFNKAMQLLHAYCIIAEGVRIRVSHQRAAGKASSVLISTQGASMLDNLVLVTGHKSVSNVIPFPRNEESRTTNDTGTPHFKLQGFISSCAHGCGRSTPDKQYYFINGRPCDLPKVNRLINQLYKQFNKHQFPIVVLNVLPSASKSVDVNLAPDKRSIVMKSEAALLDLIKETITALYEHIPSTIPLNNCSPITLNNSKINNDKTPSSTTSSPPKLFRFAIQSSCKTEQKALDLKNGESKSMIDNAHEDLKGQIPLERNSQRVSNSTNNAHLNTSWAIKCRESGSQKSGSFNCRLQSTSQNVKNSLAPSTITKNGRFSLDQFKCTRPAKFVDSTCSSSGTSTLKRSGDQLSSISKFQKIDNFLMKNKPLEVVPQNKNTPQSSQEVQSPESLEDNAVVLNAELTGNLHDVEVHSEKPVDEIHVEHSKTKNWVSSEPENVLILGRKEILVHDTLSNLKTPVENFSSTANDMCTTKFTVPISSATSQEAEHELQREITKDMFLKMSIIGQFNKAFILAKLDKDIFIIDQHAADEKFNFERLNKSVTRQSQKLIIPQTLNLNPSQELIFIENEDVFHQNGFDFAIDEEEEPSKKIKLVAVPSYLHATFKLDDILDLIHQIQEAPHEIPQSSRIRGILASKACRQSIMVGQALDLKAMQKLVNNLSTMDHPWNCPHGRPTMRHLTNLQNAKLNV